MDDNIIVKKILNFISEDFDFLVVFDDGETEEITIFDITARQQIKIVTLLDNIVNPATDKEKILKNIFKYLNIEYPLNLDVESTLNNMFGATSIFFNALNNPEFEFYFKQGHNQGSYDAHAKTIIENLGLNTYFLAWQLEGWFDKYSINNCYFLQRTKDRLEATIEANEFEKQILVAQFSNLADYHERERKKVFKKINKVYDNFSKTLGYSGGNNKQGIVSFESLVNQALKEEDEING